MLKLDPTVFARAEGLTDDEIIEAAELAGMASAEARRALMQIRRRVAPPSAA